jgi:hypothetical protein
VFDLIGDAILVLAVGWMLLVAAWCGLIAWGLVREIREILSDRKQNSG